MHTAIRVSLLLILSIAPQVVAADWWNEDWSFRKRIDISLPETAVAPGGDVTAVVRLNAANFAYFLDTQSGGDDIRFVAADGTTPLEYHIEHYENLAGVASIWVRAPQAAFTDAEQSFIWMYYGNESAVAAGNAAASFEVDYVAVFHFAEASGLPADATAYANDALRNTAVPGAPGFVDRGLQFDNEAAFELPAAPSLSVDRERGTTLSFWLRLDGRVDELANLLKVSTSNGELRLVFDDTTPVLMTTTVDDDSVEPLQASGSEPLALNRWYRLSLALGTGVELRVDDSTVAALPALSLDGPAAYRFGAVNDMSGFLGTIDELRLRNTTSSAASAAFYYALESQDSQVLLAGADESRDSSGGIAAYFGLFWTLLGAVRIEGWVILVCITALGLVSADVFINKTAMLKRIEAADRDFLSAFDAAEGGRPSDDKLAAGTSPLASLHATAEQEWQQLSSRYRDVPPEAVEVVRAAMDTEIVQQLNRLTSRLVLVTAAVSGGPFLGLLGTVLGVMVTFATIAAAGDVNVNTIAPGVSAALTTTVMGLIVAIPSLFAYNHITSRVARVTTAMEVFTDRLTSRYTLAAVEASAVPAEVPRAG